MAEYRDVLLTSDHDRTLTAPDATIPQNNIDAIKYFIEQGGTFTVNTGRTLPSYQAAMDADLIWQMVNFDIGWFSAWSYRSGGLMDGLKSVGSHVAENYHAMVGLTQVETELHTEQFLKINADDERANSLAGVDANGDVTVMAYHFKPGDDCCDKEISVKISLPTNKKNGKSSCSGNCSKCNKC